MQNAADRHCYLLIKAALALLHFCLYIQALSQPANPAIKKSQSCTVKKTIMKVEL
jgi:hypothetical protein